MTGSDEVSVVIAQFDALASTRLHETEQRLSDDVHEAAISRKARRWAVIGTSAALVAIIALSVAIGEGVHINTVLQQQNVQVTRQTQTLMRELHKQNVAAVEQEDDILQAIQSQSVANGSAIRQIESIVDPAALNTPKGSTPPGMTRASSFSG